MKIKIVLVLALVQIAQIACASTAPLANATPPATVSPLPTVTITSQPAQAACYILTAEAVHIRAEPNAASRILGHRAQGAIIIRSGAAPHWLKDAAGWSRAEYFAEVACPSR